MLSQCSILLHASHSCLFRVWRISRHSRRGTLPREINKEKFMALQPQGNRMSHEDSKAEETLVAQERLVRLSKQSILTPPYPSLTKRVGVIRLENCFHALPYELMCAHRCLGCGAALWANEHYHLRLTPTARWHGACLDMRCVILALKKKKDLLRTYSRRIKEPTASPTSSELR